MPPELKAVADRLSLAAARREANRTLAACAAIVFQRLADRLAAGLETPETALATALLAEDAAVKVPDVPPMESTNDRFPTSFL